MRMCWNSVTSLSRSFSSMTDTWKLDSLGLVPFKPTLQSQLGKLTLPEDCFRWRGSFHSRCFADGASSPPRSRIAPGSDNHSGSALLAKEESHKVKISTGNHYAMFSSLLGQVRPFLPFLKPLHNPSRYPLSILNITPFMMKPLKELILGKSEVMLVSLLPLDSCVVWWSVFT